MDIRRAYSGRGRRECAGRGGGIVRARGRWEGAGGGGGGCAARGGCDPASSPDRPRAGEVGRGRGDSSGSLVARSLEGGTPPPDLPRGTRGRRAEGGGRSCSLSLALAPSRSLLLPLARSGGNMRRFV